MIEPVFAQIKNNLRAGRFSRRGLARCRAECAPRNRHPQPVEALPQWFGPGTGLKARIHHPRFRGNRYSVAGAE